MSKYSLDKEENGVSVFYKGKTISSAGILLAIIRANIH